MTLLLVFTPSREGGQVEDPRFFELFEGIGCQTISSGIALMGSRSGN
jgi:hypothetical protein